MTFFAVKSKIIESSRFHNRNRTEDSSSFIKFFITIRVKLCRKQSLFIESRDWPAHISMLCVTLLLCNFSREKNTLNAFTITLLDSTRNFPQKDLGP